MGCGQSKQALDALRPSQIADGGAAASAAAAGAPQRLSLNQILMQASSKLEADAHAATTGSAHRDVFSIFNERGMMLEGQQVDLQDPRLGLRPRGARASAADADASPSCSPLSPTGSVFSTATTASETERTLVLNRRNDQFIAQLRLSYGAYSDKGARKLNEDREVCVSETVHDQVVAYFGLYDGHGGATVADYLAENLHSTVFDRIQNAPDTSDAMARSVKDAFAATDEDIYAREIPSGSTAVSLIVRGTCAVIASVGDSQAVLSTSGKATDMCVAHTPELNSERERILAAKGNISKGRIYGMLGVSRAFGDNDFKTARGEFSSRFNGDLVIAEPDVVEHSISSNDEFLVLGCDGLFEVMEPQQVVDYVRSKLSLHGDVQHACEELVSHAINMGSTDNVSAIVVCFNQDPAPQSLLEAVSASLPPLSGVTVDADARVAPASPDIDYESGAAPTTQLCPPSPVRLEETR